MKNICNLALWRWNEQKKKIQKRNLETDQLFSNIITRSKERNFKYLEKKSGWNFDTRFDRNTLKPGKLNLHDNARKNLAREHRLKSKTTVQYFQRNIMVKIQELLFFFEISQVLWTVFPWIKRFTLLHCITSIFNNKIKMYLQQWFFFVNE